MHHARLSQGTIIYKVVSRCLQPVNKVANPWCFQACYNPVKLVLTRLKQPI